MLLLNNLPIKHFTFPGGELQVRLPPMIIQERVVLTWKPTNSEHIMLLGLSVNALRKAGIYDIDLDILYLPYARQDRVCSPGEANSLEVICKYINDLDVSCVRIWDVHNPETTNDLLPENFVWHWEAHDIFARYNILNSFDLSNLILCAPDRGATDRVERVVKHFDLGTPAYIEKIRDCSDGKITHTQFGRNSRLVESYDVMVVDDICDGGATFIKAAEILKEYGAEDLYLYVTHGIFSKGLDELSKVYKHIYCHHVLDDKKWADDNRLTILQDFSHVS